MPEFSLESFRELLSVLKNTNYILCLFGEIEQRLQERHPFVVLRHDIDISLRAALEVASVEHEFGVQATYFVSLNSPFYNALSCSNAAILQQLHQMGHEIALHVDLRKYNDDYAMALEEVHVLSRFYPFVNTQLVSLHSPICLEQRLITSCKELNNVYGPFLKNEMAYISDSTGRWRYGYPLDSEAFFSRKPIQLLTHPIWWIQEGESPRRKLEHWLKSDYLNTLAFAQEYLPKLYSSSQS